MGRSTEGIPGVLGRSGGSGGAAARSHEFKPVKL